MQIVLNRRGGVAVRDQLRFQLELKILAGDLLPGQRLPSVRALARRLKLHPNTVSAAYKDLGATGHVHTRPGSGIFVQPGLPEERASAPADLDGIVRRALQEALRQGHSGMEIRAAVERWLSAAPPDRVVVVDPSREMAELLAREVADAFEVPASSCSLAELEAEPTRLSGALALTLPYHLEKVGRLGRAADVQALTLDVAEADRQAVVAMPGGSMVLLVSHSPTVLPFAEVLLKSLRGDEVLFQTRPASAAREWRRMLAAADLVLADALSFAAVRAARARHLREIRFLSPASLEQLGPMLRALFPSQTGPPPRPGD